MMIFHQQDTEKIWARGVSILQLTRCHPLLLQIILHAASLPPQEKRHEEAILGPRPYMGSLLISLRTPWQWANYPAPYLLVRDSCSTAELGGVSRAEFDGVS